MQFISHYMLLMFLCNISDIVLKLKYKSKSFKLNDLATILIFSLYVYIITFQSPQEKKNQFGMTIII